MLREDVKHRTSDGASYSLFVLSSPGSSKGDALGKLDRIRATQLVQEFVKTHVTVLELAATVDWLWRSEGYSDWRDEVIPSALTVDWSEWAGTLGEAHGLALQKPVSHQGGWYYSSQTDEGGKRPARAGSGVVRRLGPVPSYAHRREISHIW